MVIGIIVLVIAVLGIIVNILLIMGDLIILHNII